jgi:uncharacterized protein YdiU (UPF0061 family)
MSRRLGLKTQKESDFQELFSEMLDTLEALELDFNHFFRRLSNVALADIETDQQRMDTAPIFFHSEGYGGIGYTEQSAKERIAKWLAAWRFRILEDWGIENDADRQKDMNAVNPKVSLKRLFFLTSSLFILCCLYLAHPLHGIDSCCLANVYTCYSSYLADGFSTKSLNV